MFSYLVVLAHLLLSFPHFFRIFLSIVIPGPTMQGAKGFTGGMPGTGGG